MPKKSKRPQSSQPRRSAPTTLPPSTHPFYNSEFRPIELSAELRALESVSFMLDQVGDGGVLTAFELGRKGTHISSRFVTAWGAEDTLTSTMPNDEDYNSLVQAHLGSLVKMLE